MASRDPEVVESADSKPAVITVVEAIPPAAPQEVEVVVAPAAANQPGSVSLSWAIGAEAGVAGYAVYRSEQDGARGVRLNDELLGAPTYRDTSAAAGRRYSYSVTAVAGSGLESAPSPAVEAQIPAAQP
jgi:fibronectin type 3 domain-containing protein